MNKRIVIIFMLAMVIMLLLPATTCYAQAQNTKQWIYDAVNYLVDQPFGDLYRDINPENRYQVSLAVANTIQSIDLSNSSRIQRFGVSRKINLQEIIADYNQRAAGNMRLSDQQILVLAALAYEYRSELNVLGYWIEDLHPIESLVIASEETAAKETDSLINFSGSVSAQNLTVQSNHSQGAALNRERVLSKYFGDEEEDTQILINSLVPLWSSDWYFGAGYSLSEGDAEDETTGYAGIIGEYSIFKDIVLEGQYLHNLSQPLEPGIFQLGARGRFGNMELRGLVQTEDNVEEGTKASLDLTYGGPNTLSIRAGYNANLKTISQLSTSIDVDIPISQGRLTLGVSQEWNQERDPSEDDSVKGSDQTKASIGFNYDFSQEMSFKLDYRLIDFSDVDRAFAGFSIRF